MTDDTTPSLSTWFTLRGRILLWVVILGGGGGLFWYVDRSIGLPENPYLQFLWTIPIGLIDLLGFLGIAYVLEKLGIPIYVRTPNSGPDDR